MDVATKLSCPSVISGGEASKVLWFVEDKRAFKVANLTFIYGGAEDEHALDCIDQ